MTTLREAARIVSEEAEPYQETSCRPKYLVDAEYIDALRAALAEDFARRVVEAEHRLGSWPDAAKTPAPAQAEVNPKGAPCAHEVDEDSFESMLSEWRSHAPEGYRLPESEMRFAYFTHRRKPPAPAQAEPWGWSSPEGRVLQGPDGARWASEGWFPLYAGVPPAASQGKEEPPDGFKWVVPILQKGGVVVSPEELERMLPRRYRGFMPPEEAIDWLRQRDQLRSEVEKLKLRLAAPPAAPAREASGELEAVLEACRDMKRHWDEDIPGEEYYEALFRMYQNLAKFDRHISRARSSE